MATKDNSELLFKDKQKNVTDNGQYNNLILNGNHYISSDAFSERPKSVITEQRKIFDYEGLQRQPTKLSDLTNDSQTKKESHSWKRSTKDLSSYAVNNGFGKEDRLKKGETLSASTLSLYIEAFENSNETNLFKKEGLKENDLIKKGLNAKQIDWNSTGVIQNVFEFSRQQKSGEATDPEIAQFSASQQLLSPAAASGLQPQQQHQIPPPPFQQQLLSPAAASGLQPQQQHQIPPPPFQQQLLSPAAASGLLPQQQHQMPQPPSNGGDDRGGFAGRDGGGRGGGREGFGTNRGGGTSHFEIAHVREADEAPFMPHIALMPHANVVGDRPQILQNNPHLYNFLWPRPPGGEVRAGQYVHRRGGGFGGDRGGDRDRGDRDRGGYGGDRDRGDRGGDRGGRGGGGYGGDRGGRDGGFDRRGGGRGGGFGGDHGGRGGGFRGGDRRDGGGRGGGLDDGERGGFGGRGGGGGRGGEGRPNDWTCPCGNVNFAFRQQCHSCQAPREDGSGAPHSGGGAMRGPPRNGGDRGGDRHNPY